MPPAGCLHCFIELYFPPPLKVYPVLSGPLMLSRWPVISTSRCSSPSLSHPLQVFLPLTRLCRDSCGYCTFAQPPRPGARAYMTLDEVLAVAELGARQGCTEALLTLGKGGEGLVRGRAAQRQALTLLAWGNCD